MGITYTPKKMDDKMAENLTEVSPRLDETSSYEVAREDSRGKFITLIDNTNFPKWYEYMFHTPIKERTGEGKVRAPYNKVAINLIVYTEPKASFTQYMDVDEFLLLADKVVRLNSVPGKMELQSFVGFSEKTKMARSMQVIAQPSMKDATKVSFMLSFTKGQAIPSESGTGFKWTGEKNSGFIAVDSDAFKRFCLSGIHHLQASRAATLTRFYESLYKAR
jgi:hypothetical protein